MINYAQLAQGVLWVDTEAKYEKKNKTENEVTGLFLCCFFSSDEALSREKLFKTTVFPVQITGVASHPTASKHIWFE